MKQQRASDLQCRPAFYCYAGLVTSLLVCPAVSWGSSEYTRTHIRLRPLAWKQKILPTGTGSYVDLPPLQPQSPGEDVARYAVVCRQAIPKLRLSTVNPPQPNQSTR